MMRLILAKMMAVSLLAGNDVVSSTLMDSMSQNIAILGHRDNRRSIRRLNEPRQKYGALVCQVMVAHVLYEEGAEVNEKDTIHSCLTTGDDEPDGASGMVYIMPDDLVETIKDKNIHMEEGPQKIRIEGATAYRTIGSEEDVIIVPTNADVVVMPSERQLKVENVFGTRTVLVLRVSSLDSTNTLDASTLSNRLFGGEGTTLSSVYRDCSWNALNMIAASGNGIVNGVTEIYIDQNTVGAVAETIENAVTKAAEAKVQGFNSVDHVVYCMPAGAMMFAGKRGWIAYSYMNWSRVVLNDHWCGSMSTVVHEIGHNLGLGHSREGNQEYGDRTGMMGTSSGEVGGPAMCFNAHIHWILGWYRSRSVSVDLTSGPWVGAIVAFTDYDEAANGEYVVVNVKNLYMQYNRAKEFNIGTQERQNQLVIVEAENEDADSYLLGGASPELTKYPFRYVDFESSTDLLIEVCSSSETGGKSALVVSIHLESQASKCSGYAAGATILLPVPVTPPTTPQMTRSPTGAPTPQPPTAPPTTPPVTHSPTGAPTPLPTGTPTKPPLTLSPTAPPTPVPTVSPTMSPVTLAPTSRPTTLPTTYSPTDAPTFRPTTPPSTPPTTYSPTDSPTPQPVVPPTLPPVTLSPTVSPTPQPIVPPTLPPVILSLTESPTPQSIVPPTLPPVTLSPTESPTPQPIVLPFVPTTMAPIARTETLVPTEEISTPQPFVYIQDPPLSIPSAGVTVTLLSIQTLVPPQKIVPHVAPLVTVVAPMGLTTGGISSESYQTVGPQETNGICDDDRKGTFFVPTKNESMSCVWLSRRPIIRQQFCVEGHPSGARSICQETCGVCTDECVDSKTKFTDDQGKKRVCKWLAVRNDKQDMLCLPGTDAYEACGETCNVCDGGGSPVPVAQKENVFDRPSALALTSAASIQEAASILTKDKVEFCDDSKYGKFYVEQTSRFEPCVWLVARPEYQPLLCEEGHPSGARNVCPETCGKCTDHCRDDSTATFFDNAAERDCQWLSLRYREHSRLCIPGHEAYIKCPETCNACDGLVL